MPKVFISYRRSDSPYVARSIYKELAAHYGDESVVFDVDSIPRGFDFAKYLERQVHECDVLLVIIGTQWLGINKDGTRRIDDPNDWVYIEIEAALNRDIPVIPVLVGDTSMPAGVQLPDGIRRLSRRNSAEVRPGRDFEIDLERLIRDVEISVTQAPQMSRSKRMRRQEHVSSVALVPSSVEVREIPAFARVAFAARCARRVEPLFKAAWPRAPELHMESVRQAIVLAESIPRNVSFSFRSSVVRAGKAAADAAKSAAKINGKTAAKAAEAAARAAQTAARANVFWDFITASSASSASKAGKAAADAAKEFADIRNVIRDDFRQLKTATDREGWSNNTLVSPEFFGPMWVGGAPKKWPDLT